MKYRYYMLFISIMLTMQAIEMPDEAWTWSYRKIFAPAEREQNKEKEAILFGKQAILPFSQLLFSWNALRPHKGYFSFWVKVYDETKKRWGSWHKMAEWGADIQRSYLSPSDGFSQYTHVRLETRRSKASAFYVKVMAHNGADLSLLHSFSITLSNMGAFTSEVGTLNLEGKSSVYVPHVPVISQFELDHVRNDGLCSPTSCTMLVSYLLQQHIDPYEFAEKSFDIGLGKYGSWPFNMAHAFEVCQGKIHFAHCRLPSFTVLYDLLRRNIPVVVSVRGYIPGAPREYANGHLLVVVGYDAQTREVICHDPAALSTKDVARRYQLDRFLKAWERSHRLAYVADSVY